VQELPFWCLPICCVDGQVCEEGGSQEKTQGFLLRSSTENDLWCVGDCSLLPWAYVYLWECVFVGMCMDLIRPLIAEADIRAC